MPDNPILLLFFRYGWALFIAVGILNTLIGWRRAKAVIAAHPERRETYRRLFFGFLFWGNLPWVVMGVGIVAGGVPTMLHYLDPGNGPYVIAWYCSIVLLSILNLVWLFFLRGAETLIDHPGFLNLKTSNPWMIKIFLLVTTLGSVIAITALLLGTTRTPKPQ